MERLTLRERISGRTERSSHTRDTMWFHLKNREPFGLAGLWDVWRKPDGKKVESFTIITTEPNELLRPIHNRMPVILGPEDEEQWLDASRIAFAKARSLLKTLPAELMDAHDVSTIVNSASMTARSAFSLFQMARYLPISCLSCKITWCLVIPP
jgi:putative SOS response-associated peptidase YedK